MPIIVPCPQCRGQLRVADDLIGRKVRCPACAATFDAAETAAPPPAAPPREEPAPAPPPPPRENVDLPIPTESLDPWKHLNLELSTEKADVEERPPAAPRGAVEITGPEPRDQEAPAASRRARLSDDHDDLRPCPMCGRMIHRDARRCLGCGARLRLDPEGEDDFGPAGAAVPRMDCEPHRGGLILTLGIVGLAVGLTCWPVAILAIVPSLLAWLLGMSDLAKIRRGLMDPEGEDTTQAGWICGIVGTAVNALMILGCATCVGIWSYGMVEASKNNNRPPFAAPPGKPAQPPWAKPR
jgi:predicted Zn finger-like uncharacterized protein